MGVDKDELITGQPLAKWSDERAKAHTAATRGLTVHPGEGPRTPISGKIEMGATWQPDSVVKVREDGEHRYAIPLSKQEAEWIKRTIGQAGIIVDRPEKDGIIKKMDWVIETAERDGL